MFSVPFPLGFLGLVAAVIEVASLGKNKEGYTGVPGKMGIPGIRSYFDSWSHRYPLSG